MLDMLNDRTKLIDAVNKIKWLHTIDLGDGIITPGIDDSPRRLERIKMPRNLAGKTVLDVGSWNGFFAFEAERRGAKRVLATDSFCWSGEGWGTKDGFRLARQVLNSNVEDLDIDVMELNRQLIGTFDIVLFLGVLYHMKHPVLALEKIADVTGEMLILDTHVDLVYNKRPAIALYPERELNNDPTNWVGPNPAAVIAMLKMVGFRQVEIVSQLFNPLYRIGRGARDFILNRGSFFRTIQEDRMVFHAWK
jgi:tRNA (mo5U34)-methyltransferase